MIFRKITFGDKSVLNEVKQIYFTSFPENERRPWESLLELLEQDAPFFSLYGAFHGDNLIGFFSFWRLPGACYVEHLAVKEALRGKNVGSAVVREALDLSGKYPLVVEVELPETGEAAERRIRFYEKNGFTQMADFPYFQPPYRPDLDEVPLMLMTSRPLPDPKSFVVMLHTLVYNQ